MNKQNNIVFTCQIIALLIPYLAILIPFAAEQPLSETVKCNSNYFCKVERNYRWNFRVEIKSFELRSNTKINLSCSMQDLDSCSLEFIASKFPYEHVFIDRSGTFNNYNNLNKEQFSMNLQSKFINYMKGNSNEFVMKKNYDQTEFIFVSSIMTLIFMGIAISYKDYGK